MKTFIYVPVLPGPVIEVHLGDELFDMHPDVAAHWHEVNEHAQQGDWFDGEALSTKDASPALDVDPKTLILAQLFDIDRKTPRAMREALLSGDKTRVQELEAMAAMLRADLAALT